MIISEIYHVCGREEKEDKISSESLVSAIKKNDSDKKISYAKDIKEVEEMARNRAKDFDIILIMGAGDIDQVARRLVENEDRKV